MSDSHYSGENEGFLDSRTNPAQILPELVEPKMRFPKLFKHRKAEVTISQKHCKICFCAFHNTACINFGSILRQHFNPDLIAANRTNSILIAKFLNIKAVK